MTYTNIPWGATFVVSSERGDESADPRALLQFNAPRLAVREPIEDLVATQLKFLRVLFLNVSAPGGI